MSTEVLIKEYTLCTCYLNEYCSVSMTEGIHSTLHVIASIQHPSQSLLINSDANALIRGLYLPNTTSMN